AVVPGGRFVRERGSPSPGSCRVPVFRKFRCSYTPPHPANGLPAVAWEEVRRSWLLRVAYSPVIPFFHVATAIHSVHPGRRTPTVHAAADSPGAGPGKDSGQCACTRLPSF